VSHHLAGLQRFSWAILSTGAALLVACQSPQTSPTPQGAAGSTVDAQSAPLPTAASRVTAPSAVTTASAAAPTPTGGSAAGAPAGARTFQFDDTPVGAPPAAFVFGRSGSGALGRWIVRAEADAPSKPNVLAQLDADNTNNRFPVAAASEPELRDLRLSVQCKMVSGKVDQACGLVLRYKDENNYYITRANALEGNIRFYCVRDGRRQQLASYSGAVTGNAWHAYRIEARGDHFEVYWDGSKVLSHQDGAFAGPGKVGVWTKADSVTYFDDLSVEPLGYDKGN
jgi:hypothetical protein